MQWRAALAQLADQGDGGLPAFRQKLLDAAATASDDTAETMDAVLEADGLGQALINYAASSDDKVGLKRLMNYPWVHLTYRHP